VPIFLSKKSIWAGLLLFLLLPLMSISGNSNTLWRGPTENRVVALTFDDGPKSPFTQNLLMALRGLGVKATFFVVGSSIEKEPDLLRQIADEGHELANHSYTHSDFTKLTDVQVRDEVTKTQDAIWRYGQQRTQWFRPPGGNTNARVQGLLAELGMVTVMWTINAEDYTVLNQRFPIRNELKDLKGKYSSDYAADVAQRVLVKASPGSIVLMHNGGDATLAALPQLVAQLREQGFGFVTLSGLVGDRKD
jgi:peptidoglycan/xylan/chitin deacetylase (PgdA/CDA1 family)